MLRVTRRGHSQPDCLSVSFEIHQRPVCPRCSLCSPKTNFVLGVPLTSSKTRDVLTGLQIVRVQERVSLGVPLYRTLIGS